MEPVVQWIMGICAVLTAAGVCAAVAYARRAAVDIAVLRNDIEHGRERMDRHSRRIDKLEGRPCS